MVTMTMTARNEQENRRQKIQSRCKTCDFVFILVRLRSVSLPIRLGLNVHMSLKLKPKCHITNEIVKEPHELRNCLLSVEHRSITKFRMYGASNGRISRVRKKICEITEAMSVENVLNTIVFLTSQTPPTWSEEISQQNRKSDNLMNH